MNFDLKIGSVALTLLATPTLTHAQTNYNWTSGKNGWTLQNRLAHSKPILFRFPWIEFKNKKIVTLRPNTNITLKRGYTVRLENATAHVSFKLFPTYLRETVTITAKGQDLNIDKLALVDADAPTAQVRGTVQGSPLATPTEYFSVEHPMANSSVKQNHAISMAERKLSIRAGQTVTYSAVIGVAAPGQLRRSFDAYIEKTRAHPYRPFLHYNCWYDLGWTDKYTQPECLNRIAKFGQELTKKRGVKLASFLFDDGWDDPTTTWSFDKGLPNGFKPLSDEAAKYHSAPGAWLSPWGGYGDRRDQRLKAAKKGGYEVDSQGLALSGPKYFNKFRAVCLNLLAQGVNQFKFDGTGSPDKQYPGSRFDSDFDAAISLIRDLRKAKPDLFVNLTTGTWPSPFWTQYADSTWRGGDDHSFAGVGTWRQKWMTYRDGQTYQNVVKQGPLYPLNSLMLHGIIYARYAEHLGNDPGNDFAADAQAYFGTGTQLEEMYITPALLTPQNWDDLAAAAKWAKSQADVLEDAHWVGGDPQKLQVYGHAGWNGSRAYLQLRNPSDHPQEFVINLKRDLELPNAGGAFVGTQPFAQRKPPLRFKSGAAVSITLQPFQVLTLDLRKG